MRRSEVLIEVARQDTLIVCSLGFVSRELHAIADSARNFYMLGSMGMASSIGLGLAIGQGRRVTVVDGDGSMLMNLGSLVTIAHQAPDNFCLVIIDNKAYGSTGNQPSYTAQQASLAAIARGAGNINVLQVRDALGLQQAFSQCAGKRGLIIAETEPGNEDAPIIQLTPMEIKKRFAAMLIKRDVHDLSP